jgi:hypothetical protein
VSDKFELERQLLAAIKSNRDQLKVLLDEASSHWGLRGSDLSLLSSKLEGVRHPALDARDCRGVAGPEVPLNASFERILAEGTGKTFTPEATGGELGGPYFRKAMSERVIEAARSNSARSL